MKKEYLNEINNIIKNLNDSSESIKQTMQGATKQIDQIRQLNRISYPQTKLANYLIDLTNFCEIINQIIIVSIININASLKELEKPQKPYLNKKHYKSNLHKKHYKSNKYINKNFSKKVYYGNKRIRHSQINKTENLSSVQQGN